MIFSQKFDLMILEDFSNINDSVIHFLCSYSGAVWTCLAGILLLGWILPLHMALFKFLQFHYLRSYAQKTDTALAQ